MPAKAAPADLSSPSSPAQSGVVPSGVDGGDAPTSGSGAMRWVQADWSQLTADQQAVINRYLPPETTKGTRKMTPTPSAAAFAPTIEPAFVAGQAPASDVALARTLIYRPTSSGPQVRLALDQSTGWPFETDVAPDVSINLAAAMADDMASIIVHLGPKLGLPVIYPGPADTPNITLTLTDQVGGTAALDTRAMDYGGHFSPCNVTAYKNTWSNAAWTANDKVSPTLHVLLTHELIHCYQNVAIGDIYNAGKMPSWIIEGTADYLAVDDTGTIGPGDSGAWTGYLVAESSLTNRSYDAMGYFALLAHLHRDLWGKMATAWGAAAHSIQRSNAFIGVLHGDDSDVRDSWAESYVNNSAWQDPWVLPGFGAPTTGATQHQIKALDAPGWQGSLMSRSNTVLNVTDTTGEVVTVATDNGLISVHDNNDHSAPNFQVQSFCTTESCVCPQGTALAGQDVAPAHLSIPFVAAINAPESGARWTVIGTSLQDICQRRVTRASMGPARSRAPAV